MADSRDYSGHFGGTISDCLCLGFQTLRQGLECKDFICEVIPGSLSETIGIVKEERESPVEDTSTRGLLLWEADVHSCRGHLEESCARASELSPTPSWGTGHPFTSSHLPPLEGLLGEGTLMTLHFWAIPACRWGSSQGVEEARR